tara:strand:- start:865 stop:1104 length:240 start_codon:yes stop_codon:yes gene_type:complete
MYDKYFQANPITIGLKIPKHKGILFSGASAGAGVTLCLVSAGGTFNTVLNFNNTPVFFNIQVNTIPTALPTGLTAFYLN